MTRLWLRLMWKMTLPKILRRVVARGGALRHSYREKPDAQPLRVRLSYKNPTIMIIRASRKLATLQFFGAHLIPAILLSARRTGFGVLRLSSVLLARHNISAGC